jgi:hypothetical protein
LSSDGSSVVTHSSLSEVVLQDGKYMVKPINTYLHQAYQFYVKVSAYGGSTKFFGPFTLNVGCFAGIVTYSNNPSLVLIKELTVGSDISAAYTFAFPTATRAWCTV